MNSKLLILTLLVKMNIEITIFFTAFQQTQEQLQVKLLGIKSKLLEIEEDLINRGPYSVLNYGEFYQQQSNEEVLQVEISILENLRSRISKVEDVFVDSHLDFKQQMFLYNKFMQILRFIRFFELAHFRSISKTDNLIGETTNIIEFIEKRVYDCFTLVKSIIADCRFAIHIDENGISSTIV